MSRGRPAEDLARQWPEDARAVALITSGEEEGIPFPALELIEALAGRWRPAILASVEPGARLPDEGREHTEGPGLSAVIRGEATLKEAARARTDRPFAFLAAGAEGDPGELLQSRALGRLAAGIRSAGGILLVHVPGRAEGTAPAWLDGRIVFGDGEGAVFGLEVADLGRLAPDGPVAGHPEGRSEGRWKRHRKQGGTPVARIVAAVVGIAVIVAGWWILARETVQTPEQAGTTSVVDEAPSLPYSVLVVSYQIREDAAERVERLREAVQVPVFAAPTPVDDRLYHRVFAGVMADTGSAAELMRSLAERGLKSSASAWDLRPVRWALLLGRYEDDSTARRARRGLGSDDVYTYLLTETSGRDTSYLLYAGAFERSSTARELQRILEESGHRSEVLIRRGESR